MADTFGALVERVARRLTTPPRAVTPAEYRAIACNRCGLCCEDIPSTHSPDEIAALLGDPSLSADQRRFLAGLVPVESAPGGWRYRCRQFYRDEAGLGVCRIHETRPDVCRGFPYGGLVRRWTECAWYVRIVDENGRLLSRLPEADDTWNTSIRLGTQPESSSGAA